MTNPIPSHGLTEQRGLHEEEFTDDFPLTSNALTEMMEAESALFEYLSDLSVCGNDTAWTAGHAHGRDPLDGEYICRHGTFYVGHLPIQWTESTSFGTIYWEIVNTGGPDSTGFEAPGQRIPQQSPSIYISKEYKYLLLGVLMKAESATTAEARLSLENEGGTLVSDTQSSMAANWEPVWFQLPIENSASFDGWLRLKLELRSVSGSGNAYLCSDDIAFKPSGGQILNGTGILYGDAS